MLKKCLAVNFWRKKEHPAKHFVVCENRRIITFSWWFSWFFRIKNVHYCFLILNVLFNEVDRGIGHEKKKHLYPIDTIYIIFSLKDLTDDLKLWLVVTLVENKDCAVRRCMFIFRHLALKKSHKRYITEYIYLMF